MLSLHRLWLQGTFQQRQLVKRLYSSRQKLFCFFNMSIVEAKNIINVHITRYFILVFCWGFYCLT